MVTLHRHEKNEKYSNIVKEKMVFSCFEKKENSEEETDVRLKS
jgi:hypothetical protein